MAPTRELCLQITDDLKDYSKYIDNLHVLAVYGGASIEPQIRALKKGVQVIVATPGRLVDLMNRGVAKLNTVKNVVLDEADEMLKMGFISDIRKVMALTPKDKQIALFSATMPREIQNITWQFMQDAAEIDVMPKEEDHPDIDQFIIECPEKDKLNAIVNIMEKESLRKVIVFCNTKTTTSKVGDMLTAKGLSAKVLHGDIGQGARNKVMDQYRADKFDVLVATDVVARGIDVDDIEAIFNYDIPKENELYLHRIGRTARAGKSGKAFSLVAYLDRPKMEEIIRYTKVNPVPYEI